MFYRADDKIQKLDKTILEKNRKIESVEKMKKYYQKRYQEQSSFLGKFNELDVIQNIASNYHCFNK